MGEGREHLGMGWGGLERQAIDGQRNHFERNACTLLSADTVSETIAENADVRESSTDVERLTEAIGSLTAWLLGLADGGVQFASLASEAWGTLALVRVFSLVALTTVQTWLRSTHVLVEGDFYEQKDVQDECTR